MGRGGGSLEEGEEAADGAEDQGGVLREGRELGESVEGLVEEFCGFFGSVGDLEGVREGGGRRREREGEGGEGGRGREEEAGGKRERREREGGGEKERGDREKEGEMREKK
jgi:hypothetical protein